MSSPTELSSAPAKKPWYRRRPQGKFLIISILAHVALILVATYLVVSTFSPRKQTFKPGPKPSANKSVEHKIEMVKKQKSMSAPAQMNRIVTKGLSKVVLPDMPSLKTDEPTELTSMAGMGGVSTAFSGGGAGGGSGGGAGGLQLFGLREKAPDALVGVFYDMKQTRSGNPTNLNPDSQAAEVRSYVQGGFSDSRLNKYFKGPDALYAKRIAIPMIQAGEGPKAFNLADKVQPKMWLAVYRVKAIAPRNGTFHFVGFGDDFLYIQFNNKLVLDAGWMGPALMRPEAVYTYSSSYDVGRDKPPEREKGFVKGKAINVKQGQVCDILIVIGEAPGGQMGAQLMVEWEGASYDTDPQTKAPILELFRVGDLPPPPRVMAPVKPGGSIWKTTGSAPLVRP